VTPASGLCRAGDENRTRTVSLGSWTTCLQVVFSCCWNAADLVLTPPQMYRRRPLLTVANGTLMAGRSWPSMGRCRQLAARRRPPGQGSPAPAGGGAPHSELFEHATRSAPARARLVRQDEHPRKAPESSSRSRSVKTASAALVTASAASCFRAELRLRRRLPPEQRAPPREQPVQPPRDQPEPPGISISRCCPRHPTMFRADVSRKDQ